MHLDGSEFVRTLLISLSSSMFRSGSLVARPG
jgi:hypothetical protein